uniref:Uncharacterized protein n=1 Tax=Chlamydomonas euryale TaxID=1486919 RepID=A0A7R9VVU7_9CHLO|mmetsp:Transcript_45216/g.134962  ORF Transcript_45216/g.134962 Transcript_45216/m.134962 type:complete len:107 (+) Transcript_45216:245-565(+)
MPSSCLGCIIPCLFVRPCAWLMEQQQQRGTFCQELNLVTSRPDVSKLLSDCLCQWKIIQLVEQRFTRLQRDAGIMPSIHLLAPRLLRTAITLPSCFANDHKMRHIR